jgi:hypothetical protein
MLPSNTTLELGKTLGAGLADANAYKQDFIETDEVTNINLVAIQSIDLEGSWYLYQRNIAALNLFSSDLLTSVNRVFWFDEGTGSLVTEEITGSTTSIASNSPTWVTSGKFNSCLYFNGDDQYINTSIPTNIGANESFTLNAWIKHYGANANNNERWFYADSSTTRLGFGLGHTGNKLQCLMRNNADTAYRAAYSSTELTASTWYMVTLSYNSATDIIRIWLNGVSNATEETATGIDNTGGTIRIGSMDTTSTTYLRDFNGLIDDIVFWKGRELTGPELLSIYNSGTGLKYFPNTRSGTTYYPFVLDHPNTLYGGLDGSSTVIDGDFSSITLSSSGFL